MRVGVRLQILAALGALLLVAFAPLYLAVARLTEASLVAARMDAAQDLGRSVASSLFDSGKGVSESQLGAQLSAGGISAIAMFDSEGNRTTGAGTLALLPTHVSSAEDAALRTPGLEGSALLIVVRNPVRAESVAMVVELDPTELPETPLVRLVALYTGVIALALLVFAYFAMTRLVVQPIEAISRGASRIAGGINTFEIPASRTKEFGELSDSLQTMLARLMAKEALLLSKIAELERITRELRDAQESIVRAERLASVGRLAAGIAHEIGNPIAAILGFEELLLSGGLEREEERDFLQRMKKETDRVHRVLRDLLDFARTGQGSPDSANRIGESTEVASNVETVLALLRPQRKLQDLHIENAVPNDLPRVKLAGERLQQVLLNLLINASDAARRRIRIEAAAQGQRVQLIVEDDGAGVSEAIRERLFEPFATTKDVGEGTGLGLAVCRGIIERAQGSITLGPTGRLGGALFIVELPAST